VLVAVAVDVGSGVAVAVGAGVFVVVGTGVSVGLLVEGWLVGVLVGVGVAVGSGVFVDIAVGSGVQVSVRSVLGLRVGTIVSVTRPTMVAGVAGGETRPPLRPSQPSNILISTATNTHLQAGDHRWSNPIAACGRTIFSPARRNALTISNCLLHHFVTNNSPDGDQHGCFVLLDFLWARHPAR
jgi:hypothetical protein